MTSTIGAAHADPAAVTPEIVQDDEAALKKKLLAGSAINSSSTTATTAAIHSNNTQYVAFRGLFVVQSATEARHVRYAMDIVCPELQLQLRVTERYNSFYLLRKRLLQSLKKCHVDGARPTLNESSPSSFVDLDFHRTLLHPCCAGCAQIRKTLKSVPFPKRSLMFTTAGDVDARPPQLEAFLDTCFRLVADWQGCVRGKKFACVVLGKFLSLNLLFHIFQQLRLTMLAAEPAAADHPEQQQDHGEHEHKGENMEKISAVEEHGGKVHAQTTATNQVDAL